MSTHKTSCPVCNEFVAPADITSKDGSAIYRHCGMFWIQTEYAGQQKQEIVASPERVSKLAVEFMSKIREVVADELKHAASLAVDYSDSKRIWDYRTQRLAEFDAVIKEMESNV